MAIQDAGSQWIYLDQNTAIWNKHVPFAQGVYQPIHWVALARMQAELRMAPYEGRVVDMGCGHGVVTVNLAWKRARSEVIGIDPDKNRFSIGEHLAREHGLSNVRFQEGSIEQPGIEPGSCTGVICTEVLEHLPDAREHLKEKVAQLMDLLMPHGRLILSILDKDGAAEMGVQIPSPLRMTDFGFIEKLVIDRNCPRWWWLFSVDKE